MGAPGGSARAAGGGALDRGVGQRGELGLLHRPKGGDWRGGGLLGDAHGGVHGDDADDFFEGGLSVEGAAQAPAPEGDEAFFDGDLFEGGGGHVAEDGLAQSFGGAEQFGDGHAAAEAGMVAFIAAVRLAEVGVFVLALAEQGEEGGGGFVGAGAELAVLAEEAEADDPDDAGGEEEGFDLHVDEAGEDAGTASAVDGADDEVAGEAGAEGDHGGFGIADFADHDDLGVLAEEGAEGDGVGEVFGGVDLGLADHGEAGFDGVFDGADADAGAFALDDVLEGAVDEGGFAGAGGAGEEHEAVGLGQEESEILENVGVQTEGFEVEFPAARVKDADDDFAAADGGEDGDAQFDPADLGVGGHLAFLGEIALVGDQAGHDFEALLDPFHPFEREVD